ncbi:hypothetical protein [Lacisediminimonas sp.]|uniref:hypothetical protein n=1 Tax=Lacisediminimonas sp. TaxID=3060582 RepID=UPI00271BF990|nr:hypothetical protein [Lacisediminimonas sp.]MDO8298050.1 hypothetical protein [Lacisediminimonas sp.]MDO9216935.1 hypothetical protein [Lacisediminimonas sp.]
MSAREMQVPLSGHGPAILTLPDPLTPDALHALETSLATVLGTLRAQVCGESIDAGQLEYASWMPQLRH